MSIRMVAFQGLLLGILPLTGGSEHLNVTVIILSVASIALKSILLPSLLTKALVTSGARREIEPFVGFGASMLSGMLLLAVSG